MECTTPLVSILFRSHSSLSLSICWRCADTLRLRLFSICSSLRATYSALAPRNGSASSASPKIDWKSVICVFVYEVDTQNCLDMNSVCWNLTTFRIEQSTSSPAERRTFFSRLHPQTACVFYNVVGASIFMELYLMNYLHNCFKMCIHSITSLNFNFCMLSYYIAEYGSYILIDQPVCTYFKQKK